MLSEGVFSSNFFFFKYSTCTNLASPCATNVAMPPSSVYKLPEGAVISRTNYYVAFYVQLTNNFNTSLPLLATTFEQFGPIQRRGVRLVDRRDNATLNNGVYYPSYTATPSLVAYPSDCSSVNAQNKPTDNKCIYVNPGRDSDRNTRFMRCVFNHLGLAKHRRRQRRLKGRDASAPLLASERAVVPQQDLRWCPSNTKGTSLPKIWPSREWRSQTRELLK